MRDTNGVRLMAVALAILVLPGSILPLEPAGLPLAPAGADEGWREAAREVHRAAGEKNPGVLADAVYALRNFDGPEAAQLLLGVVYRADAHDVVLDAAGDALASFQSEEATGFFVKEAARAKGDRRFALLEALGRIPTAGAEKALLEHAEDPEPMVRTAAVRSLADRKKPAVAARVALERAALDPDSRVRSAAIGGLRARASLESGLPLLDRLVHERGRLFGDAWRALQRVAGENLPPDPDRWADWWRTQPGEEDFRYSEVPGPVPPLSVSLSGLGSWSRRVVFVLDLSEGMADKPGYRLEDILPTDVRAAGGKELDEWKKVESRLDHARMHLVRAIRKLPDDAAFDMVFGAESSTSLFGGLEPATEANRERAVSRLAGLNAKGRQDYLELMTLALSGKAGRDPLSPEAFRDGPDTVVYVGTALPSFGAEDDAGRIVSRIRRWNRVRQVSFLGLGVGNHGRGLLGDLATLPPVGATAAIP